MVLIQKYYKRFLGKTLLQKGYSPNPFPKTLNDFYPPMEETVLRNKRCSAKRFINFLYRYLPYLRACLLLKGLCPFFQLILAYS